MKKIKIKNNNKEIGTWKTEAFRVLLGTIETRGGALYIGSSEEEGTIVDEPYADNATVHMYGNFIYMDGGWRLAKVELDYGFADRRLETDQIKEEKTLDELLAMQPSL